MKKSLKNIAILTLFAQFIVICTPVSRCYAMEDDSVSRSTKVRAVPNPSSLDARSEKKPVIKNPSRIDWLLGGLWGVSANRFSARSLLTKAIFLFVSPLSVMAQGGCRPNIKGTASCQRLGSTYYSSSECGYSCGGSALTLPLTLAEQYSLRVDLIGGHLVTSCSGALQTKYQQAQADVTGAQEAIQRARRTLEQAERDLEAARQKAHEVEKQAATAASTSQTCPKPEGLKKQLPLPGSASQSCEDTTVTESSHQCTYSTHCKKLDGTTKTPNTVKVYKTAPDCRVDGTSTQRQENCNGALRPRQYGGDAQCTNKEKAEEESRKAAREEEDRRWRSEL